MSITECASINGNYSSKNPRLMLSHLGGLPINELLVYHIISYDDENLKLEQVEIKMIKANLVVKTYKIPLERVITIDVISNETIKTKEKSVVGRGIVGGVAFGPAGLILGGMSGLKDKTVTKTNFALCISYLGKTEEEIKNIVFDVEAFFDACMKFAKDFQQKFNVSNVEVNDEGEFLL